MSQVRNQSASELLGGEVHASQHTLDDVTVMAQQTPWLLGVVAMVGAYLASIKGALADRAAIILSDAQPFDVFVAHSGTPSALVIEPSRPFIRVGLDAVVAAFVLAAVALAAALPNFGAGIILAAALLYFLCRPIGFSIRIAHMKNRNTFLNPFEARVV